MTRVIHTGDTHLGYRQYHRPERREDFLAAFRQVADDAVADDVDAVVHAGDLFHDRRPNLEDIMGALSVLETLDDAGIPFLAVVGNHEAKRSGQWLDLFESLGLATRLESAPVVVGDTALYGLDFVPRAGREGFEPDFEGYDAAHAALVTHGLFEPFDFGEWDPREVIDPADVEFDALLLGDNHRPETAQVDGTWLTYCGSTERASTAEREERGYNLVTFDDGVDIRRRGLDTREFVYVEVDLSERAGPEAVRQRVGEYDVEGAVVVVEIDGEGDPLSPASVEEYALEEGALVARVTDHRETAEDDGGEVSFADPDDAVRERVRELGLSRAARDIDETVRASKVADTNVAGEVESRVGSLVEDGDLDAFVAAETADGAPADAGAVDESADTGDDRTGAAGSGTPDSGTDGDNPESPPGAGPDGEPDADTAEPPREGSDGSSDGDATLEDFA